MNFQTIAERLTQCGLPHGEEAVQKLLTYHQLLSDWNTRMDLTAVTDDSEMLDRHYIDSLMALRFDGLIPEGASLIDVGTGAGFPGMPLAIARPDMKVSLLDSQQKRLTFLQEAVIRLGLKNVELIHSRAEDGARTAALREHFDLAVARAVAPLAVLAEYLLPYVRIGGAALCWKGPALAAELQQGQRAAFLLGGKAEESLPYHIPGRDWEHCIQPVRKLRSTPSVYPRKAGTPSRQPLGSPMLR